MIEEKIKENGRMPILSVEEAFKEMNNTLGLLNLNRRNPWTNKGKYDLIDYIQELHPQIAGSFSVEMNDYLQTMRNLVENPSEIKRYINLFDSEFRKHLEKLQTYEGQIRTLFGIYNNTDLYAEGYIGDYRNIIEHFHEKIMPLFRQRGRRNNVYIYEPFYEVTELRDTYNSLRESEKFGLWPVLPINPYEPQENPSNTLRWYRLTNIYAWALPIKEWPEGNKVGLEGLTKLIETWSECPEIGNIRFVPGEYVHIHTILEKI